MAKMLTEKDEDKVMDLIEAGYLRKHIAKRFNVSKTTINLLIIKRNQSEGEE